MARVRKLKVGYVILHYKNIKDTEKCIDSILRTSVDGEILVVDNGSGDGTGEKLRDTYGREHRCSFLLLDRNYGFSGGNNRGVQELRKQEDIEFIVVTNNDVVFYQNDFENRIISIFGRTGFHVLGPDVYIPGNDEHQSPLFLTGISVDGLEKELDEYRYYRANPSEFIKRLKLHFIKNRLCSKSRVVNKLYAIIRKKDSINYKCEYEDVGLQGSCIIFSKQFYSEVDKVFDPEPFLYCEEALLYFRCKKDGYKMVYSPEIGIRHEEAASLKNSNKNEIDRMKFMLEHHVAARELLLQYLKDNGFDTREQ